MREFKDEYEKYINEDMPDLWSRIEPNLKEKTTTEQISEKQETITVNTKKPAKIYVLMKKAVPAAAAIAVLLVGLSVMQISRYAKTESAAPMAESAEAVYDDAACEEAEVTYDMDYADDAVYEDAGATCDMDREEYAASEEKVADEDTTNAGIAASDEYEASEVQSVTPTGKEINLAEATLIQIRMTDTYLQEQNYNYVYTFRTKEQKTVCVYITEEQCAQFEKDGLAIERQAVYNLTVIPVQLPADSEGDESEIGSCIMVSIEAK